MVCKGRVYPGSAGQGLKVIFHSFKIISVSGNLLHIKRDRYTSRGDKSVKMVSLPSDSFILE